MAKKVRKKGLKRKRRYNDTRLVPYDFCSLRSSYYLNFTYMYRIVEISLRGDITMYDEYKLLIAINLLVLVPYYILFIQ